MYAFVVVACAAVTGVCHSMVPSPRFADEASCKAALKSTVADVEGKFAGSAQAMALQVAVKKAACFKVK